MTTTCKICGWSKQKKFPQHLRVIHNMTKEEYDEIYPLEIENPLRCKFCNKILKKQWNTYCGHSCHAQDMLKDPNSGFGFGAVWNDPKYTNMMYENLDKIHHDPENLKRLSENATKRNLDPNDPFGKQDYGPEFRAKMSISTTRRNLDPNSGIGWRNLNKTPEFKDLLSRLATERNADPNSGFGFGNLFKDPQFIEDQIKHNNNPEVRKIRSETAKRLNADDNSGFGNWQGYGLKGYHESEKARGLIFYGSGWELRAYKILDNDINVKNYERGPKIPYFFEESDHTYNSDILVTYTSGSKRIIEVKRDDHKFEEPNPTKYRAACLYSKSLGYLPFKVWDGKYL